MSGGRRKRQGGVAFDRRYPPTFTLIKTKKKKGPKAIGSMVIYSDTAFVKPLSHKMPLNHKI